MSQPQARSAFSWREFLRALALLALPVALQNLLTTTASMIDTVMVAPLGELPIGAIGLCAQFSGLLFSCYWGFVGGGSAFFSQYWGSGENKSIRRSYGMTLTCMMAVALVFTSLALFAPRLVMGLYTDKPRIQEIGVRYLGIVGFAYPLQVLSVCTGALLRSTERVRIPLLASVASVAANLLLNWVFIYGNLGCPALGVEGAALATACAAGVNVLVTYLAAALTRCPFLFRVREQFRWTGDSLRLYLRKCFPILCNGLLMGVGNTIISLTLGRQNEEIIAAVAVFRTLEGLIIGFFEGFSNAASVLVGKSVGAGEPENACRQAKRLVYFCSAALLPVGLLLLALHRPILSAMSLSGESLQAGAVLLTIYVFAALIRMGNWIHIDTFRAGGDTAFAAIPEILGMYVLVLPAVLLTGFVWHAPYWVIFLCCYIDEPIRYLLMELRLYSGKWIRPVTEAGRAAMEEFQAKQITKRGDSR